MGRNEWWSWFRILSVTVKLLRQRARAQVLTASAVEHTGVSANCIRCRWLITGNRKKKCNAVAYSVFGYLEHLWCTVLERVSFESARAVHFSAATNNDAHAAHAPFHPAHNWTLQQGDVPFATPTDDKSTRHTSKKNKTWKKMSGKYLITKKNKNLGKD